MSFPWDDEEQSTPVPVPWQKVTDEAESRLTRKERRELAEKKANKKPTRIKKPSKAKIAPAAHAASKSRRLPPSGGSSSPTSSPIENEATVSQNEKGSTSVRENHSSSRNRKKISFSRKDAATAGLLAGTLGFGMLFALADFTRSSTVYADMEDIIKSTQGEIIDKNYDESNCPSGLYTTPVNSQERNRSMTWGEVSDDGKSLVCLDSPYFFTVDDEGEEVVIPVEENVYDSYESGDTYSFDQELYDQRGTNARSTLPDEENNVLKYGSLSLAVLSGAGAIGLNLNRASHSTSRREENGGENKDVEPDALSQE